MQSARECREKGTPLPVAALRTIGIRLRPMDDRKESKDIYVLRKKITDELEIHWARGVGEKSAMRTQSRIWELPDSIEVVQEMD